MPASEPLPAIRDLLGAFGAGVVAQKDARADVRRGAVYDHFAGVGAILFSREAQRDRDLFRARYFDTADGADLTELVATRFAMARILDTYGTGSAVLARDSTAMGEGTVWEGTRILLAPVAAGAAAREYAVLEDTPISATATIATVGIRATRTGTGVAVSAPAGLGRIDDPLWDSTWRVQTLVCGDGTDFEKAAVLRARARQVQLDARKGYAKSITDACVAEGAAYVALFASNYGGDAADFGLNACYVAAPGFTTTPRLIRACAVALERYRVCGADLQVFGMAPASLRVSATVTLWDDPSAFATTSLDIALRAALSSSFESLTGGFSYSLDALRGAMLQVSDAVQDVVITSPYGSAPLLVGSPPNFPGVLTRYSLDEGDIALAFAAPT
jgi:hypothetical protein